MGKRNYLIEGVSGTGKTSVCHELRRRGYTAFNSDRDLRPHTVPTTGERLITQDVFESWECGIRYLVVTSCHQ